MLHEAVGPNALAHKELSVSAVTFLSVLTILVKVSCSQLPWYFRAWAGCYLFGWLTVQVLLIMFHFGGDIRDSDLETLVRYGRWLSKLEDYDSLRWEIDDTRGGLKFVIGIFLMVIPRTMAAGIVGSSLVMLIVGAIMDVLHSIKNSATLISKTKTLPILLGWVALNLLFWFGWISSFINFMVSHESLDKVPLWVSTSLRVAGTVLEVGYAVFMACMIWGPFYEIYANIRKRRYRREWRDPDPRNGPIMANLMTVLLFAVCLTRYSEEGTGLPEWVSWLG
ncbi:unnamed protein product [Parascedosporium putredinis]|uniref:Uncharacterized protein n=1 Tax=Parascedosporium putredinis TaxID=1442378 RepID=A0A9P1MAH6_9PEZI|nr:unnamed protein product [Parascedosporium putredinis]CAI7994156.1 unnamed protein product [Parascedosporium putredinis]